MIHEVLAFVGAMVILLSAVGVNRFRDPLSRLHALSKASTLGVLLLLAAAALALGDVNSVTSVVLAGVLHLLVSPPASNMLSRATWLDEQFSEDIVALPDDGDKPVRPGRDLRPR